MQQYTLKTEIRNPREITNSFYYISGYFPITFCLLFPSSLTLAHLLPLCLCHVIAQTLCRARGA